MSGAVHPVLLSVGTRKRKNREMMMVADAKFPAITAQNVGREIYHGRKDVVRIVGDKRTLGKIAWIFQKVPDMFTIHFQCASLVVAGASERWAKRRNCAKAGKAALKTPHWFPAKFLPKLFSERAGERYLVKERLK